MIPTMTTIPPSLATVKQFCDDAEWHVFTATDECHRFCCRCKTWIPWMEFDEYIRVLRQDHQSMRMAIDEVRKTIDHVQDESEAVIAACNKLDAVRSSLCL